jgi:transcriptional regulator with XRE-family HTH domain
MAKQFSALLKDMPKKRRNQINAQTETILKDIDLQELRKALELTQNELADTLHIKQAAVSKIENQSDMFISTLRRFLIAMGANLKIIAEFQDHEVVINQFNEFSKK